MDMPGFAPFRRQQLVVHRHEIIQERFVHLDEKTEQEGVTPRGGQTSQGMDIVAPREPRQVLNDARTDISESLFEKYQAASRLSIKRVIATYTNVSLVVGNSS